jgi:hypothetical protein
MMTKVRTNINEVWDWFTCRWFRGRLIILIAMVMIVVWRMSDTRSDGSSLFSVSDFRNPDSLAVKFGNASDSLSSYLRGQFSDDTQQRLDAYNESNALSVSLQRVLVDELNQLIHGPILFDEQRFEHIELTEKTRSLIEQNPQGENLIHLNQLLLEEAYPHAIVKSQFNKSKTYRKNIDILIAVIAGFIIALTLHWISQDDSKLIINEILEFKPRPTILTMGDFFSNFDRILTKLNQEEKIQQNYGIQCVFNTPLPGSVLDFDPSWKNQCVSTPSKIGEKIIADLQRLCTRQISIEIICQNKDGLKKTVALAKINPAKNGQQQNGENVTNEGKKYADWILCQCNKLEKHGVIFKYMSEPPPFNCVLVGKIRSNDEGIILELDEAIYGFIPTLYYDEKIARDKKAYLKEATIFGFVSEGERVKMFSRESFEYLRKIAKDHPETTDD